MVDKAIEFAFLHCLCLDSVSEIKDSHQFHLNLTCMNQVNSFKRPLMRLESFAVEL